LNWPRQGHDEITAALSAFFVVWCTDEGVLGKKGKGAMTDAPPKPIDHRRRRIIGVAAMSVTAAQFESLTIMNARAGAPVSFNSLKQIDAGVLNIGYVDTGPADGPVVILLHGWPYDIHSFAHAAPLLVAAGHRVIVPHLRGYGTTRFLSDAAVRNGQQSAVAVDLIALMDALKIERAVIAGFDWGARTANIVAALWPARCTAMVSVSGYLIGNQKAGAVPLPPAAELQWWYQYYFATERGRLGYEKYRRDFAKLIWQLASPKWHFDDATFSKARQRSTTQIMSRWSSTTTVGASAWQRGRRAMTIWRSGWQPHRRSVSRLLRWRVTAMALPTRRRQPMRESSPAGIRTGISAAVSGTTCRRRRPKRLPKPSSTS